jgi:hypothetical protein
MKRIFLPILLILILLLSGCGQRAGFGAEDLCLEVNGETYFLHSDVAEVLQALGTGYEYAEARSCDYDGLDKTYLYDIAEFYTYPRGSSDMLNEIYSEDVSAETSKGIGVGDSKETVLASYGEDCEDTGYQLIYNHREANDPAIGGSLLFDIEGGVVSAITVTNRAL